MIKVGIVDDHKLIRKGLSLIIDSCEGLEVVLEAEDGRMLFDQLGANLEVDVLLLDLHMPNMDGYESCQRLKEEYPDIMILIVSQQTTRESIHKVMELGAHGFFTKNCDPQYLESAIKSLHGKGFYFGVELGAVLREAVLWDKEQSNHTPNDAQLSAREIDIIRMASKECSNQEISDKLFITVRTVETHRKHILVKTGARNFIGAVVYALRHNLIDLD
jgi:two-component system, NarL family, response regulator DegU